MLAETNTLLAWTLVSECAIPGDVNELLVAGEEAVTVYKTIRENAILSINA